MFGTGSLDAGTLLGARGGASRRRRRNPAGRRSRFRSLPGAAGGGPGGDCGGRPPRRAPARCGDHPGGGRDRRGRAPLLRRLRPRRLRPSRRRRRAAGRPARSRRCRPQLPAGGRCSGSWPASGRPAPSSSAGSPGGRPGPWPPARSIGVDGSATGRRPAALAVLVLEHTATAFYLPLAAALLAPGDAASRITALAGLGGRRGLRRLAGSRAGPAAAHRAVRAVPLRGGPGAAPGRRRPGAGRSRRRRRRRHRRYRLSRRLCPRRCGPRRSPRRRPRPGRDAVPSPGARGAIAGLRDLSAALAGLALGLLVPAAKLPGALAGGIVLAALTGATKVLTGWWAAGQLRPAAEAAPRVGPAGQVRAGLTLVPRGELAVAVGILVALSAPGRGPGTGFAALTAVLIVLTAVAPSLVRGPGRPGPPAP